MADKGLMSEQDMERALVRIAHEILERNKGAQYLVLVGMQTRGVPLAKRLALTIKQLESVEVPVGSLDISLYRDDLSSLYLKPVVHRTDVPTDVTGKHVVLVDDVPKTSVGKYDKIAIKKKIDEFLAKAKRMGRPQ